MTTTLTFSIFLSNHKRCHLYKGGLEQGRWNFRCYSFPAVEHTRNQTHPSHGHWTFYAHGYGLPSVRMNCLKQTFFSVWIFMYIFPDIEIIYSNLKWRKSKRTKTFCLLHTCIFYSRMLHNSGVCSSIEKDGLVELTSY